MGPTAMSRPHNPITRDLFDAVLFDLDGVLTSTAKIHSRCWKTMFDDFLARRARERNEPFRPFDIAADYKLYVDGKLRYEGVRGFLASRNISLPEGTPADPPPADTVCGLGNRKDALVKAALDQGEVESYPGSVAFVRRLREQGIRTAVVSSSNNCEQVLRAVGLLDLRLGTHPQDDDFLDLKKWDFANTPPDKYPLLLYFHPLVIYRHQVIKQADIVLAMFVLGHEFSAEQKKRNFDYYDKLTTGNSSLPASIK